MKEYIEKQKLMDIYCKQYRYESDKLSAIQELPTVTQADIISLAEVEYSRGARTFVEKMKEKCYKKCSLQDEENFQYPSYLELGDIYKIVDELLKEMGCNNEWAGRKSN